MLLEFILLQARSNSANSFVPQLILVGGFLLIFYLFMILPQQRKQKQQQQFRDNLKVGDKVVTIGGMHGKIIALNAETITLEADKGTRLVFDKIAISVESTQRVQKSGANS
ncbi:MAG: preprotein translocase subunit YajC [Microscillaceae bacterium]|jgi:preprotein translocase subunit YajC|nr:preprotein translocase subunit YajC [Microscillaceae bacterium]